MAIVITYHGDDDGVLAQVIADGDIDSDYNGNTHRAIDDAADAAGVDMTLWQGSDLNMIEWLAGMANVFLFKLDDVDGTIAGIGGGHRMDAAAPAYLVATRVLTGATVGSYVAASADALNEHGSVALVPGKTTVMECVVNQFPTGNYIGGVGLLLSWQTGGVPGGVIGVDMNRVAGQLKQGTTIGGSFADMDEPAIGTVITILVNGSTRAISYRINGESFTTGATVPAGARITFSLGCGENNGTDDSAGKTAQLTLRPRAADMTGTYPANCIDIYGEDI